MKRLVVAALIALLAAGCGGAASTPTRVPPSPTTQTVALAPTATATPSPTPTATPTATPTSTPDAKAVARPKIQAYFRQVGPTILKSREPIDEFITDIQLGTQNPSWSGTVYIAKSSIKARQRFTDLKIELLKAQPPEEAKSIHEKLLAGIDRWIASANAWEDAATHTSDKSKVDKAVNSITTATDDYSAAITSLDMLLSEYGIAR